MARLHQYHIKGDDFFPGSILPVLHYESVINLPWFLPGATVKKAFSNNGWTNNWVQGIYTCHHYHSITHEAMAVIKGKTILQLGGEQGRKIHIAAGDVIIIPAGVAHRNLGKENDVTCVGGYPEGRHYDMKFGYPDERPETDHHIAALPVPYSDPVYGTGKGLCRFWN